MVYENGRGGDERGTSSSTWSTTRDGTLDPADGALGDRAPPTTTSAPVSAVFVENTHMPAGHAVAARGHRRDRRRAGLPVHLDGARLFNAEVATGVSAAPRSPRRATTVMCCLSKGLGAPVGSLLAGPADLIDAARGERKRLGGAMRQAGVLAAPAASRSATNVDRLAEDHDRARDRGSGRQSLARDDRCRRRPYERRRVRSARR